MQAISPRISARGDTSAKRRGRANFTELMALYERNYVLLKQLFTDLDLDGARQYLGRYGRLQFTPLERERYTTTALLTYELLSRRCRVLTRVVQLKIRIYQDTRQAELLHPAEYPHGDVAVVRGPGKAFATKWVLNCFLNKLLESPARRAMPRIDRQRRAGRTRGASVE